MGTISYTKSNTLRKLSHPLEYGCDHHPAVDPDPWITYVRDVSTGVFMPILREVPAGGSCRCGDCLPRETL